MIDFLLSDTDEDKWNVWALDFVHRPVFYKLENTTFRKMDLFPSSEGGKTPTQLDSSPEDGDRSSFRNGVFFPNF
jgi:hypothetical protein